MQVAVVTGPAGPATLAFGLVLHAGSEVGIKDIQTWANDSAIDTAAHPGLHALHQVRL